MQKVIITGANGFVGSNVVNYFLSKNIEVLAIDIVDKPTRLINSNNLKYIKCDVESISDNTIQKDYYDTFIHFAWRGSAGEERKGYNIQIQNAMNTVNCLKYAKSIGCKRFVCAGSIMEYEVEAAIHGQENKPGMAYIYGMGKHLAHCLCKSIAADINIELVWPMITNAYGVGEYSPRFINTTLRKIINNEKLEFTSAIQNYDFVYIDDVAQAFYLISEKGKSFCEYVIGSGEAKPLKEFITEIRNTIAPSVDVNFGNVPFTGVNMPINTFSINDLQKDCGYKQTVSFKEGIIKTYNWLKEGN